MNHHKCSIVQVLLLKQSPNSLFFASAFLTVSSSQVSIEEMALLLLSSTKMSYMWQPSLLRRRWFMRFMIQCVLPMRRHQPSWFTRSYMPIQWTSLEESCFWILPKQMSFYKSQLDKPWFVTIWMRLFNPSNILYKSVFWENWELV